MHGLGYVHRDLKPDNIVLNLSPLEVRVIDFDAVMLETQDTKGKVRGTPGYFPVRDDWRDGSKKWDVWSLAAILLEADMEKDEYIKTKDDKETKCKLRKHLKYEDVCHHLRVIWEGTLQKKKKEEMITIDEIAKHLRRVKFRSY